MLSSPVSVLQKNWWRPPLPQGSASRCLFFSPAPQQARKKSCKLEKIWQFDSFTNTGICLIMNQIVALLVWWVFFSRSPVLQLSCWGLSWSSNWEPLGCTLSCGPFSTSYFLFSSKQQLFKAVKWEQTLVNFSVLIETKQGKVCLANSNH